MRMLFHIHDAASYTHLDVYTRPITYGDKISKIQLAGKLNDEVNKTEVEGTFEWEKPNEGPSGAGDYEAAWLFTPTGDNAYLYAPVTGKATIKVNKAPLVEGVDVYKRQAYIPIRSLIISAAFHAFRKRRLCLKIVV